MLHSAVVLTVLLGGGAAQGVDAQNCLKSGSTLMLLARQTAEPAQITQATFGMENLLLAARLENRARKAIRAYRLGWIVVGSQR